MKNFIKNHFTVVAFIILALAVFGLYAKSITFDWQYLDDDVLILDKQDYLKLSNIKTMFTDNFFGVPGDTGYRPLINVSFAIDRTLSGLNPVSYHISNILIFLLAVFSIYLLFSYKNNKIWSLIFSLIIAVNPLLCAIVCRPVDRSDSLLTLFSVLSFYFLLRFLDTENSQPSALSPQPASVISNECERSAVSVNKTPISSSNSPILQSSNPPSSSVIASETMSSVAIQHRCRLFFSLHFLFFAAALFTKETALVLPIIFILFLFLRRFCRLLYIIHYTLYIAFFLFLRYIAIGAYSQSGMIIFYITSIFENSVVLIKYFYNLLIPITNKLTAIQDISLFVFVFLLFLLLFIKTKYQNIKLLVFTVFSFILFLLPTMVMSNHMHSYFQNRIFLSMVCAYYVLLNCLQKYKISTNKVIIFCLILILFIYADTTFFKMNRYQNRWTAFTGELIDTPNSPYINAKFGMLLADIGMYEQAEDRLQKAISLEPYNYMHYENLALVYYRAGDIDKAKTFADYAQKLKNYENFY